MHPNEDKVYLKTRIEKKHSVIVLDIKNMKVKAVIPASGNYLFFREE